MSSGFDWKDILILQTHRLELEVLVNDLISGVYNEPPKITAFENVNNYDGIVFQGNIKLHSFCSHHHLPFIGNNCLWYHIH